MFEESILGGGSDHFERALELDDLQHRIRREEVRLAVAFLGSAEINELWHEASDALQGQSFLHLDDLVDALRGGVGGFPLELRPLGPRRIDSRVVRERAREFLLDIVGNAARIRSGVLPPGVASGAVSSGAMTQEIYGGIERAMRLVDAWGSGYRQAAYLLTGLVMDLAELTQRRLKPGEDIDTARIETVRRALRRVPSLDDSSQLIITTTFDE